MFTLLMLACGPEPPVLPDLECRIDVSQVVGREVAGVRTDYVRLSIDYCLQGGTPACLENTFWVLDHREQPPAAQNTNLFDSLDVCLEADIGQCLIDTYQASRPELSSEEAVEAALVACQDSDGASAGE